MHTCIHNSVSSKAAFEIDVNAVDAAKDKNIKVSVLMVLLAFKTNTRAKDEIRPTSLWLK